MKLVAAHDAFKSKAQSTLSQVKQLAEGNEVYKGKVADEVAVFDGLDGYKGEIEACDQILIATPPGFRPIHYKYAIEQGKHVFMEKPCCVDAPGYRMLMETNKLADEKKLNVMVGLQRRRNKNYQAVMEKIWAGEIGDLVYSNVYWNGSGIWYRDRNAAKSVCEASGVPVNELSFQVNNWYHFNWLCGDHICEQHVHNLDIGNWAHTGQLPKDQWHPVKAMGMGSQHERSDKGASEIYNNHYVEFTFADGTKMFSMCRQIPGTWNSVSEHLYGTKGYAEPSSGQAKIEYKDGKDSWRQRNPGVLSKYTGQTIGADHAAEHVDMALAIRGEIPHFNDGWFGAQSTFTAVFGRMATYSGKELSWDEAAAKGSMLYPCDKELNWESEAPVLPNEDGSYNVAKPGVFDPYA